MCASTVRAGERQTNRTRPTTKAAVPFPSQSYTRNYLLSALSADDFALLQPDMERVELHLRQTLVEPGVPIEYVYFLEGGICSIVAAQQGQEIEAGIFGREGLSGTPILLGARTSPHHYFMQVNGNTALRIKSDKLIDACEKNPRLRGVMLRFVQTLTIQAAETAVANAQYTLPERLARWLLMCHDRTDGDELRLTHEFMATMLGVRRSGVTTTLRALREQDAIRSRRGVVMVADRARLEAIAGGSYGTAEVEYGKLIRPLSKSSRLT
jgi:CRP-like cAMP-binding protein